MRNYRKLLAALLLFVAVPAGAQPSTMERIQAGLDAVARGLNTLGKRAEELLGPGLGIRGDQPSAHTEKRAFNQRYPVGPAPVVSVFNEFGEIRVSVWEERVVQVAAEIIVGAETADVASEVSRTINVNVTHTEDLVEVRTFLPDTRRDMGVVNAVVNYVITVPRQAGVITDNFFGDTHVRGVGGLLAVESQYGVIDLAEIAGPVKLRAHGELPLRVSGLAQGGVFQLQGSAAEFSRIAGQLAVNCFRGRVSLRDLEASAAVEVVSDSGPIEVALASVAEPDLTASVVHGDVKTDLPVQRSGQLNKVVARHAKSDATQRIVLSASFADISVRREGAAGVAEAAPKDGAKPFNDTLPHAEPMPPETALAIDAAVGNVRLEGTDGGELRITATRIVWVPGPSKAQAALDALQLQVQHEDGRIAVSTVATEDMAALECRSYRIDLLVSCPRGVAVNVHAESGLTSITGMAGEVVVFQSAGGIVAENNAGSLNLANQNGDVSVSGSTGPVKALARYGVLRCENISGVLATRCVQGNTIIDAARGEVTVRNTGGDVRILALPGIGGAYDVLVENGDLSMLLAPETDATLTVAALNGVVHSAIPLSGTITRDTQKFSGVLREGLHAVRLESRGGDITID